MGLEPSPGAVSREPDLEPEALSHEPECVGRYNEGVGERLLVFNCHEAWIAQLDGLPYEIDILVGLPGRATRGWDERARPVPSGARFVTIEVARASAYFCTIVHNPADLLEARAVASPRLFVIHNTLEGRMAEEPSSHDAATIRAAFGRLVEQTHAYAAAVSPLKAASWAGEDGSLVIGYDIDAYGPHVGSLARGLRVTNHAALRRRILKWDLHEAAFGGVPMTLVGDNPGIRGAAPARSFQHLMDLYRVHRFFVHTADPELEDGYNMATVEAMASGLPVLGNVHPSSPIEDGVSGYLSDDPAELAGRARQLLADPALAARLGAAARETARARFSHARFAAALALAIDKARARWAASGMLTA